LPSIDIDLSFNRIVAPLGRAFFLSRTPGPSILIDELDAGRFQRAANSQIVGRPFGEARLRSSLSHLLCHPQAETAHLVIRDELNSCLFERYLDSNQRRNIACNWPMAFFDALNRGRPDSGGLR
jgi:hypothetical protein